MDSIAQARLLTDIFGSWPSFHDAEVKRLELLRGDPAAEGPNLEADVHLFEITSDVAPSGHLVLRQHTLATLGFLGVRELDLVGFNHQNVLMGLEITDIRGEQLEGLRFRVSFDPSFGVSATFVCRAIAVLAVKPCVPGHSNFAV